MKEKEEEKKVSSWRERRRRQRSMDDSTDIDPNKHEDDYVPFVSAAKRLRMEREALLNNNDTNTPNNPNSIEDDAISSSTNSRQANAKQRKQLASMGNTTSGSKDNNNDGERRETEKSLLEQATELQQQQQESNVSQKQKQLEEEEQRILKEASKVQTNALQAASELAKGVIYKNPMTTSWSCPRHLLAGDHSAMRDKWHILVEGNEIDNDCPPPMKSFADMKLPSPLLNFLKEKKNIQRPTPIQMQGLPVALAGRDMVGIAFTGSGKTVTFSIPLVMLALEEEIILPLRAGEGPIGILLGPSRELVRQTFELVQSLCQSISFQTNKNNNQKYPEIRASLIMGGEPTSLQLKTFRETGVHCIVATPGRLKDCLKKHQLNLDICRYICLDEADRMLDLGFDEEVSEIMNFMKNQRQTLLFSATFPQKFRDFAKTTLVKPIVVNVGRAGAANLDVIQEVEYVKQEAKIVYLCECLQKTAPPVIIFCERKGDVDDIHEYLLLKGVQAVSIHGDKDQQERNESINLYKEGKADVLVATDIAAKGLDFADIQHVINFDMPTEIENYVHRIGRTGRCGKTGVATTFINKSCPETTLLDLKHLLKEAHQRIPPVLTIMDDPLEQLQLQQQQQNGTTTAKGCSFCGGLGHTIVDCPKIDKDANRVKRKDALASGDGYGGDW